MTKQDKPRPQNSKIIQGIIIGLIFSALFVLEPSLRDRSTFAVTYFEQPQVSPDHINTNYLEKEITAPDTAPIAHAPEPSTLILFLGGIAGIFVRFVRTSYGKFKRYSDLLLAILGVMVTSPLLIFAAILIKLTSKGPVIYKQDRVGEDGEIFRIYKLRTMVIDAEEKTGAVWAKENDPRITSVGRVLRKAHIDEMPQLFNVIKGEMSIVGPRPERPEMVRSFKNLIVDYERRLQIKPGITGMAQVFHKYDETTADVKKKIKYDLLYIRRMCLRADLRIMAQTCLAVLTGRGAR